jgi:hypothetical protein
LALLERSGEPLSICEYRSLFCTNNNLLPCSFVYKRCSSLVSTVTDSAKVRRQWSYTSAIPYIFIAGPVMRSRDNFTSFSCTPQLHVSCGHESL